MENSYYIKTRFSIHDFLFLLIFLSCFSNSKFKLCCDLSVASSHHLSLSIAAVPFVIIINNKLQSYSVFHGSIYFVGRLCIVCCMVLKSSLNSLYTIHNSQFSNGIPIHLFVSCSNSFEWIPKIIDQSDDSHTNRDRMKNDERLF